MISNLQIVGRVCFATEHSVKALLRSLKAEQQPKSFSNRVQLEPRSAIETEPKEMNDLPELPFEKVLSYLSLKDRIRSRAVSRRWYTMINSFRVKSLCFSTFPSGLVERKCRWISRAYAQNFISSPRPGLFFDVFGSTILSNLKHLRLYDVRLNAESRTTFASTLQSFGQLEELDLIYLASQDGTTLDFELNLPVLKSIQLVGSGAIGTLTVDAPNLRRVELAEYAVSLRLNLVHVESVERLIIADMQQTEVAKLKNLKYLYCASGFAPTALSDLLLLKEIHLGDLESFGARELFDQKQRDGRADLKIHVRGVLLNDRDELAMVPGSDSTHLNNETFAYLAENPSRLADEIPFYRTLHYTVIERVAPGSEFNVLSRLTHLHLVLVLNPVQNVQRFLDMLKNLENVIDLCFACNQPQELFDRLPEHCAVFRLS